MPKDGANYVRQETRSNTSKGKPVQEELQVLLPDKLPKSDGESEVNPTTRKHEDLEGVAIELTEAQQNAVCHKFSPL